MIELLLKTIQIYLQDTITFFDSRYLLNTFLHCVADVFHCFDLFLFFFRLILELFYRISLFGTKCIYFIMNELILRLIGFGNSFCFLAILFKMFEPYIIHSSNFNKVFLEFFFDWENHLALKFLFIKHFWFKGLLDNGSLFF